MGLIHFLFASSFGLAGTSLRHSPTTTLAAPPSLQQLRSEVWNDLPSGLHEVADDSVAETSESSVNRHNTTEVDSGEEKIAVNMSESGREEWGKYRGNLGTAPPWYVNVPKLHKTLNEATGLHDIYEIGHYRTTTTTLWNMYANAKYDWFAMIPPTKVKWNHVHRKIDELRGHNGPGFSYPEVPTTVPPAASWYDYDIGAGGPMRVANFTLEEHAKGHHTPMPATRLRGDVAPVKLNHLKLGGKFVQPAELTAADVWEQLEYLINKTGVVVPPPKPKKPHNHTIGTWDKLSLHLHKHAKKYAHKRKQAKKLHHLKMPPTRAPVPLLDVKINSHDEDHERYLASLDGLDKVLYMLDRLLEKAR